MRKTLLTLKVPTRPKVAIVFTHEMEIPTTSVPNVLWPGKLTVGVGLDRQ